jgi:LysR family transcriptional regulator, benzoate and cis,cis-muconate-responsive activator of ben and cat genes
MELRHLRYFVAVAENEHFGRAAELLHVSQSPLSRQIAQLEEEIGFALFTRVGRGVKLSPAGRSFLEGALATLARADQAVADARATAQGRIGTVVIGFEGGIAYTGALPKIIEKFRLRHPRAEVRLVPLQSEEQSAALHAGTISVGYGYASVDDDAALRSRLLLEDRMCVAFPKAHRLISRRVVRIDDLLGERFVWGPRNVSPRLYDAVVAAFRARGHVLRFAHEIADGEALLTLVASGEGLSFFPESAARLIRVGAALKRVQGLDVVFHGRLLWRVADEESALVRSWLTFARAAHKGGLIDARGA